MTMRDKINVLKNAQTCKHEVIDALKKIIKDTYDDLCCLISDIYISDKEIEVDYCFSCRGERSYDHAVIPIEWLDEGYDYKSAYEKKKREIEERHKREEIAERKRAEAAKRRQERNLYLKLKKKYEKEGGAE